MLHSTRRCWYNKYLYKVKKTNVFIFFKSAPEKLMAVFGKSKIKFGFRCAILSEFVFFLLLEVKIALKLVDFIVERYGICPYFCLRN
jgi:hypothetical protein